MNEIAKLIDAYNKLWSDIEIMQQDITNIVENEFNMELFTINGDLGDNIVHNIYFKSKDILYVRIDVSVDIPFLQIFKLNLIKEKKMISSDYLKTEKWFKNYNPNEIAEEEETKNKKVNDFSIWTNNWVECIVSPKVDIMSINSTDIVNTEIKDLISCIIINKIKSFSKKELIFIE